MNKVDLSKINEKSMTSVLNANYESVKDVANKGSVNDVLNLVENLFNEAGINTKASNRLLNNIRKSKTSTEAIWTITNSMLSGFGESVI